MKAFVVSGLLLLLVSGMWRCSEQQSVLVKCNYHNLHVIAKRTLFYQDELVDPDELFLGTGCKAVILRADELEFIYPIHFCGIVVEMDKISLSDLGNHMNHPSYRTLCDKMVADRTILYSWLTYKPKNKPISAELQLQCVIPRWAFLLSAGSRYNTDFAIVVAVPT